MNTFRLCLLGLFNLIQSLSGVFALLCLAALTLTTWHLGATGGLAAAWCGFFGVVPAILCYAEHKETMQTALINNPQPPPPPIVQITDNMPPRGQL